MNTATVRVNNYTNTTVRERKVSLIERVRKYLAENKDIIISGLAFTSGNASIYNLYRSAR